MILSFFSLLSLRSINPQAHSYYVNQNQPFQEEIGRRYRRISPRAERIVPTTAVRERWRTSTSISLVFLSNTTALTVGYIRHNHMNVNDNYWTMIPATSSFGFTLYAYTEDGFENIVFPTDDIFNGSSYNVTYHYRGLPNKTTEYHLFFPNFEEVLPESMIFEIDDYATIKFAKSFNERPVVIYGTSITHGKAPAHPAITWANIVHRRIDHPIRNFGIAGEAMMENATVSLVLETEPIAIIYDCLPNLCRQPLNTQIERQVNAVQLTRRIYPDVPIIMIDFACYINWEVNSEYNGYTVNAHQAYRQTKDKLLNELHITNIEFIPKEELNYSINDFSDEIHPTEVGMAKHASVVLPRLYKILDNPNSEAIYTTQKSLSQYRYLGFRDRHYELIESIKQNKPTKVLIGDDIVHQWLLDSTWVNTTYYNMGMYGDRIENVVWRVIHEEMYGYTAEKIVVIVGGNNLNVNNDTEIVEGFKSLLARIRRKQPSANIIVSGVFPRKGLEQRVKNLNTQISAMIGTLDNKITFTDLGSNILAGDVVDDDLVVDGGVYLEPSGYAKLTPIIAAL